MDAFESFRKDEQSISALYTCISLESLTIFSPDGDRSKIEGMFGKRLRLFTLE